MNKQIKELLRENNKFEECLSKDSQKVITDIVVYLRGSNISEYYQEEARRDIMQMVYDGEQRNESIERIIGEDYKIFCDEIISAMPKPTKKENTIKYLSYCLLFINTLSALWLGKNLITKILIEKQSISFMPITIGDIVTALFIIFIITIFIKKFCEKSFEEDKTKNSKKQFLRDWLICSAMISIAAIIQYFFNITILKINVFIVVGIIIVTKIIQYFVDNSIKY